MTGATSASAGGIDEVYAELAQRCDTIEEAYEFLLAYAAQGLLTDEGSSSGGQARQFLQNCDVALGELPSFAKTFASRVNMGSPEAYTGFLAVLDRDSRDAQAAVRLVLAQPAISSSLVDNLNASIHLRALLTDLFLIDEVLKGHRRRQG